MESFLSRTVSDTPKRSNGLQSLLKPVEGPSEE
jgi:hypothetical protein